jgi:hypothetical protein
VLEDIGNAVTAGSAVAAAFFAWRALETWKVETRGRRRSDLATSVLSDFYKVRSIIQQMRNAFYRADEYADMPEDAPGGSTALHVIAKRMERHSDFFDTFQSRRFEFAAVFGPEHEKHYQEVIRILNEVQNAAQSLVNNEGDRSEFSVSMRKILNRNEGDTIDGRVDAIVAEIETLCRPEIDMAAPKRKEVWRLGVFRRKEQAR